LPPLDARGETLALTSGLFLADCYGTSDLTAEQIAAEIARRCNRFPALVTACVAAEAEMSAAYRLGLVDSLSPKGEASSFTQTVVALRGALRAAGVEVAP